MQLSNQALGAIMLALQESLLNELDIVPILKSFELSECTEVLQEPTVFMLCVVFEKRDSILRNIYRSWI